MSLPGRGRGHSRGFVAADPDRVQNLGRPHPRTPIMRQLNQRASKKSLTGNVRLDNEANLIDRGTRGHGAPSARVIETKATAVGVAAPELADSGGYAALTRSVGILLTSSLRSAFHVSYAACMRIQTPAPSPNNLPSRTATAGDTRPVPTGGMKLRVSVSCEH
jgi:hypothetical protein